MHLCKKNAGDNRRIMKEFSTLSSEKFSGKAAKKTAKRSTRPQEPFRGHDPY